MGDERMGDVLLSIYHLPFTIKLKIFFARNFFTKGQKSYNTLRLRRGLTDEEKLEFVNTSVSLIEGRDIMDSCFILNFGYDASLPWPQVCI